MYYDVKLIARYIIKMLQRNNYTRSKIKIMKILYFLKGHYYQEEKKELFTNKFEAWINGPVISEVYQYLTYQYSWSFLSESVKDEEVEELCDDIKVFIEKTVQAYGSFDDDTLIEGSHREVPWESARVGLAKYQPSKVKIKEESLRDYYVSLDRKIISDETGYKLGLMK